VGRLANGERGEQYFSAEDRGKSNAHAQEIPHSQAHDQFDASKRQIKQISFRDV